MVGILVQDRLTPSSNTPCVGSRQAICQTTVDPRPERISPHPESMGPCTGSMDPLRRKLVSTSHAWHACGVQSAKLHRRWPIIRGAPLVTQAQRTSSYRASCSSVRVCCARLKWTPGGGEQESHQHGVLLSQNEFTHAMYQAGHL